LVLAKDTEALQNTALGSGVVTFQGGALATRGVAATLANRFVIGNAAGAQSQILGDQNLTFTGIVTGAQTGGQNYFVFNNSTGVVTFAGRLQANSANNVNGGNNGLTVAGSGNTVISNGILNGGFDANGVEFANSVNMVTNFVKQGSGRLEVLGTSTNTGTTRLEAGYLRLSSAGALSTSTKLFIGEQPANFGQNAVLELGAGNATFARNLGTLANEVAFGGNSAGFASVTGTSTVSLGVAGVANGAIVWGSTASFVPGNSVLTLGSAGTAGTLDFTNAISLNNANRTVRALNGTGDVDGILSGVLSNGGTVGNIGSFTKDGAGTLALTAANTYTGTTTISAGSLALGNGGAIGALSASSVIVNNGDLTINRSDAVSQGAAFSSAAITGTGSFTQKGTGTTTLTAANTYSGGTAVTGGTLLANNATGSTGSGAVTVTNAGTLLGGNGKIAGAVTIGSGARLTGGTAGTGNTIAAGNIGTLTVGALTLGNTSSLLIDIALNSTVDKIVASSVSFGTGITLALNIASDAVFNDQQRFRIIDSSAVTGTFSSITATGFSGGSFTTENMADGVDLVFTAVPEPSTWMGAGMLLGLAGWSLRKRKSARLAA
jgi:autotransporter-associated beta strand protein